ncbi:MAG: GNAT family N-acetyltransferase [Thermoflexales bacterium]
MLTRHADSAGFLAAARPALEIEEAANNLILGLPLRLLRQPETVATPPYFATVARDGRLAAAAVMTPPYNAIVWAAQPGAQAELGLIADDLYRDRWPVPGVGARAPAAEEFCEAWQARAGGQVSLVGHRRIYRLDRVVAPALPPGEARLAEHDDTALIASWMKGFYRDAGMRDPHEAWELMARKRVEAGDALLWTRDGAPVSMAARSRLLPRGAVVGMVYTPPEQRGQGYASAVVAALSQRLLDAGNEYCALYTDLANPTSNSIYQKIGYAPVSDAVEYAFG